MNYLRVNLLRKGEQRHQGAVSRRFLFVSIVVTPILLIALLSGVKLIQYNGVQDELKASRAIWADLEPRLELFKKQQRGLAVNRQVIDLINGWQDSQVAMEGLLMDIQQTVPRQVQLSRLSIRTDIKTSVYHGTDGMDMDFRLILQGVSEGAQAEDAVILLRKDLLEKEQLSTIFTSVKLASMRKRDGRGKENMREFSLEGRMAQEGAQE
jgi:hypothetical protein